MFVNLDYSENLDFIYKWKDSLDPLIDALVNQEDMTQIVKYTTNLNVVSESGQNVLNQEAHNEMIHQTCMTLITQAYENKKNKHKIMRNFGVNCTEFYSVAKKKCSEEGLYSVLCRSFYEMVSNRSFGHSWHFFRNNGLSNFGINCDYSKFVTPKIKVSVRITISASKGFLKA